MNHKPKFWRTDRHFLAVKVSGAGLVDVIGCEKDTRAWLEEKHGIVKDTEARDIYDPEEEEMRSDPISSMVGKSLFSERLRLDEVISLWHPQSVIMAKSAGPVDKQEYPKNDMMA